MLSIDKGNVVLQGPNVHTKLRHKLIHCITIVPHPVRKAYYQVLCYWTVGLAVGIVRVVFGVLHNKGTKYTISHLIGQVGMIKEGSCWLRCEAILE